MPQSDPIKDALASAHKALDNANNSSVSTRSGQPFAPKSTLSTPSYGIVAKARNAMKNAISPAKEDMKEAGDTAAGIKARQENVNASGL